MTTANVLWCAWQSGARGHAGVVEGAVGEGALQTTGVHAV